MRAPVAIVSEFFVGNVRIFGACREPTLSPWQAAAIAPAAEPTAEEREAVAARAETRIERGAKLSRWFDVKEHWSVLGMLLSAGLVLILWPRGSEKPRYEVQRSAVGLALLATIFAWLAAIIGVVVTAARSVAPL